ncbi:SOS response-associated protein YedK [Paraconexibacter sp. AEG42_29]|uniref:Abasic site processing protein n=1 Tax=Paraconexibacter sp. AEG42_29 TaxID=2997339 RepID=A0AAU7AVJ0_9ACTN
MCGRYSLAGPNPANLRERFALGDEVPVRRRWNVAPGDDILAVTTSREGERRPDILRWGFVPFWAKDPKVGYKMINARSETAAEKPAFRDALSRRRCLILADGFYEWQPRAGQKKKQPFWITRADGEPFAFAGLWGTWHAPDDSVLRSCTIITTAANDRLTAIHDRMPVMLPSAHEEALWLDASTPAPLVQALMATLPSSAVTAREVGYAVSDARHDEPDCLDPPLPPAETAEPTLF